MNTSKYLAPVLALFAACGTPKEPVQPVPTATQLSTPIPVGSVLEQAHAYEKQAFGAEQDSDFAGAAEYSILASGLYQQGSKKSQDAYNYGQEMQLERWKRRELPTPAEPTIFHVDKQTSPKK